MATLAFVFHAFTSAVIRAPLPKGTSEVAGQGGHAAVGQPGGTGEIIGAKG